MKGTRKEVDFINALTKAYPKFAHKLRGRPDVCLEHIKPPISQIELDELERSLRVPLPESYKSLLRCARGFWLLGGAVQFGTRHPFLHQFPPLNELSEQQRHFLKLQGNEKWPPPSTGMLCFAEFFMDADGDQVLFDIKNGLIKEEYPIMYYDHETVSQKACRYLSGLLDSVPRLPGICSK